MHINAQLLPQFPQRSLLFHLGSLRDAIDYYQAIGLVARDGSVGKSIVYFNPMSLHRPIGILSDPFGKQVIYDMLHDDRSVGGCVPVFSWTVLVSLVQWCPMHNFVTFVPCN